MAITDIKLQPLEVNWNATDLGSTIGGMELAVEVQSQDLLTDQTGSAPADSFFTGVVVNVTVTLLELNTANYTQMIAQASGGSKAGDDATVYGWGSSRNFTSMLSSAQILRLRPVGNGSDESEDITFWKALPIVDSLSFSADSARSMSVTFRCFIDSSKDSGVSLFAVGDVTGI